jgi:hypothetical protein
MGRRDDRREIGEAMSEELNIGALRSENAALHRQLAQAQDERDDAIGQLEDAHQIQDSLRGEVASSEAQAAAMRAALAILAPHRDFTTAGTDLLAERDRLLEIGAKVLAAAQNQKDIRPYLAYLFDPILEAASLGLPAATRADLLAEVECLREHHDECHRPGSNGELFLDKFEKLLDHANLTVALFGSGTPLGDSARAALAKKEDSHGN